MASETNTIKTYMSFGIPVDPANIKTLVDLDLSYALAGTLVDWSDSRTLKEGLAHPTDGPNEKEIIFTLRPGAKWSDGSKITAEQVVRSFARAKKVYGEDLKSLFEMIEAIETKDTNSVLFRLNRPVGNSQIHHKLTEPMYGIIYVGDAGKIELSKSSGPFSLQAQSPTELVLAANPYWYGKESKMAGTVVIRQPKPHSTGDHDGFAGDSWPNIVASSSLMPKELERSYEKEHFSRWNRNLDRIFFFAPSMNLTTSDGRQLFQVLNRSLDRAALLKGLSGYRLSQQFFPPGYIIYDDEFQVKEAVAQIPAQFRIRPLELLAAEGRVGVSLQQNISVSLEALTGHKPHFTIVPLREINKARSAVKHDIFVGSLAVNDPNVEGAVSFFFSQTPPMIPNSGALDGDFISRIIAARGMEESRRNTEYRRVFSQSVQDGCILPLFHFSSIVVARDGIDLSSVPTSDDTVAFSKVRFK
jgi:MarR-like DNA-binding transcriptional regulator SgrR of sgrS sRNA